MNLTNQTRSVRWFLAIVLGAVNLSAADFSVATPGGQFNFQINSVNANPTITLQRGRTYTFAVGTSNFHPFAIGTSVFGATPSGVTGNNTFSGTITFAVPLNAANCVYYCGVHGASLTGNILMVDPPVPPPFSIVGLTVSNNISLKYTGTNGFTYTPEANTNLGATNWFALTVQTNMILSGTNEVICGLPSGSNVFFRIRAQ